MTAEIISKTQNVAADQLTAQSSIDRDQFSQTIELQRLADWYNGDDIILPQDDINYIEQQYYSDDDDYDPNISKRLAAAEAAYEVNEANPDASRLVQDAIGRLAIKMLGMQSRLIDGHPIDMGTISSPAESDYETLASYLELYADISHKEAMRTGSDITKERARSLALTAIKFLNFSSNSDDSRFTIKIEQLQKKLNTTYAEDYYNEYAWATHPNAELAPSASPEKIALRALQRANKVILSPTDKVA